MTAVGSLRSAELGTFVFSEAAFFESARLVPAVSEVIALTMPAADIIELRHQPR